MHAILIDPETKSVSYIDGDFNNLQQIYAALGCDTFDAFDMRDGEHVILVDDEGLLKPTEQQHFFRIKDTVLAGRGILVSVTAGGDYVAPAMGQAGTWRAVRWVTPEEAAEYKRVHVGEH